MEVETRDVDAGRDELKRKQDGDDRNGRGDGSLEKVSARADMRGWGVESSTEGNKLCKQDCDSSYNLMHKYNNHMNINSIMFFLTVKPY